MSTDNRKPEYTNTRTDKQDEKIGDLPNNQPQNDKDADQVKGGMRKNVRL